MVLRMVWASLDPLFATLGGFLRGLFFLLKLQLSTLAPPHCSRGAPNRSPGGPGSPTRNPHDEVDGPTRPPRLIWRRVRAYFPVIWIPESKKNRKQETPPKPFRGDFAAADTRDPAAHGPTTRNPDARGPGPQPKLQVRAAGGQAAGSRAASGREAKTHDSQTQVIVACCFFVCSQSFPATLPSSKWLFFFSWSLSVAVLSVQPDPQTFKTV